MTICNKSDAMSLVHEVWPGAKTPPALLASLVATIASFRLEIPQVRSAMTAHALEDRYAQVSPHTPKLLERLRNLRYVKEVDKTSNHSMKWSRADVLRHRWKTPANITDAQIIASELRQYHEAFPCNPVESMTDDERATLVMAYAGPVAEAGLDWERAIVWACELVGVEPRDIEPVRRQRMKDDEDRPRVKAMLGMFGKSTRVKPSEEEAILRECGVIAPVDVPWDS